MCGSAGAPADDPASIGVDDERQVDEACAGGDVGEVRHLQHVRRRRAKLPVLGCPLLSGPSTMTVWIKEGATNAFEEAQARGDHRQAA